MKRMISIILVFVVVLNLFIACGTPVNLAYIESETENSISDASLDDKNDADNSNYLSKNPVELRNEKVSFALDINSHTITQKLEDNIAECVGYVEKNEYGNYYVIYASNAFEYYVYIECRETNLEAGKISENLLVEIANEKPVNIDIIDLGEKKMMLVFSNFNAFSCIQDELLNELSKLDSVEKIKIGYIEQHSREIINNYEIYANLGQKYEKNVVLTTYEEFSSELGDLVDDYNGLGRIDAETFEDNYVFVVTNNNYSAFKISDAKLIENTIYFTNNIFLQTGVANNLITTVDSCVLVIPKKDIGMIPDNYTIKLLEVEV